LIGAKTQAPATQVTLAHGPCKQSSAVQHSAPSTQAPAQQNPPVSLQVNPSITGIQACSPHVWQAGQSPSPQHSPQTPSQQRPATQSEPFSPVVHREQIDPFSTMTQIQSLQISQSAQWPSWQHSALSTQTPPQQIPSVPHGPRSSKGTQTPWSQNSHSPQSASPQHSTSPTQTPPQQTPPVSPQIARLSAGVQTLALHVQQVWQSPSPQQLPSSTQVDVTPSKQQRPEQHSPPQ
jgi:hypothetical protein